MRRSGIRGTILFRQVFVFDVPDRGSDDSNRNGLEVPAGVVLPSKCINFKLWLAKSETEFNLDTNNGTLLDSLPRDDFGAAWALGLENWRDFNHLSFDFIIMGPLEVDRSVFFVKGRNPFFGSAHVWQIAQVGVHIFQCITDVCLILFFANIVTGHEGVGGGFFNPSGGLKSQSGRVAMRNLFFDMEVMFQKHSCCDGGVETPNETSNLLRRTLSGIDYGLRDLALDVGLIGIGYIDVAS